VAVGADQRVGVGDKVAVLVGIGPDGLRQIFKVDLMADAGAGRHDAEVVEGVLTPFQEDITLHVAFIFAVDVGLKRARRAEFVDHDRVVDDQINRSQRVDALCIAAKALDAVAHRGKVHHSRNAGEILHQHAGRTIGDFARVATGVLAPIGEGLDVIDGNRLGIFKAQHVFQHHLERGGKFGKFAQTRSLGRRDRVIRDGQAARAECLLGLCAIVSDGDGHAGLHRVGLQGSCRNGPDCARES
jgi:hypothetical protein